MRRYSCHVQKRNNRVIGLSFSRYSTSKYSCKSLLIVSNGDENMYIFTEWFAIVEFYAGVYFHDNDNKRP